VRPELGELQRRFFQAVTAGADGADLITDQRLEVYADMYLFRLLAALDEQVPKLAAFLGPEAFAELARAYLAAHPSRNPSLRHLAARLPDFLAGREADLGRLELARNDAFDAADDRGLDAAALASIPAEEWADLRFALRASVRCLTVSAGTAPLWKAMSDGLPAPRPDHRPVGCVVWRDADFQVWHRATSVEEVAALRAVAIGEPFGRVCELLSAEAREVQACVARWFGDRLIAINEADRRSPGPPARSPSAGRGD
jgi:hypothetical protein